MGQRGGQPGVDLRADRSGPADQVPRLGGRWRAFPFRPHCRLCRAAGQPPQPEGRGRGPSLRPSPLRDGRVPGAGPAAARCRRGHAVVGDHQAGATRNHCTGSHGCAVGGPRRADGQGTAVPLHAGCREAGQVQHAGGQRLACQVGRRVIAGRRHRHHRQPSGLPDPGSHRGGYRGVHGLQDGLGVRLGCAARPDGPGGGRRGSRSHPSDSGGHARHPGRA
mmetsp:Transcript_39180/g.91979  ORF Transcript_39180/g.91979 Transcript_39180/m.91979 type:complete len:221 (-) Transcript_39180:2568-3230(-)